MRNIMNCRITSDTVLRTAYSYMLLHWRDKNIIAEVTHNGMVFQERITDVDKARDVWMYILNRWNTEKIKLHLVEYEKKGNDPLKSKISSLFKRRK